MRKNPDAIFFEEQPLRKNPLAYFALLGGAALIGFFGYAVIRQVFMDRPFGDRPMSDGGLLLMAGLYMLLGVLLLCLFYSGGLTIEVRPSGLYLRYFPFHRQYQQIPLEGVRSCTSKVYRPVRDYGGWGIRIGIGKKAYNVSGNRGVELEYEGGRKLLIGTDKPGQLASAIESIRREQFSHRT
jgi:hypothetical protein